MNKEAERGEPNSGEVGGASWRKGSQFCQSRKNRRLRVNRVEKFPAREKKKKNEWESIK